MKKLLLFSIIGAIILFAWQFLSYAFPNFHKSAVAYTAKQDTILSRINEVKLEDGMYWLNQPDPSLSSDEQEKWMEKRGTQPWAVINYHTTNTMSMTMPMIRSVIVGFVISMLLFWLFRQQSNPTLLKRIYLALAVGMIGFFFIPYSNFIWYKAPDIFAHFFDAIVPWVILALVGHKLAMPKKETVN
jgi:hypothetical protein